MMRILTAQPRYLVIFWTVTLIISPFWALLVIIGLVSLMVTPSRTNRVTIKIEWCIDSITIWRDNLPWIKRARDRAHLFDYIKTFK